MRSGRRLRRLATLPRRVRGRTATLNSLEILIQSYRYLVPRPHPSYSVSDLLSQIDWEIEDVLARQLFCVRLLVLRTQYFALV